MRACTVGGVCDARMHALQHLRQQECVALAAPVGQQVVLKRRLPRFRLDTAPPDTLTVDQHGLRAQPEEANAPTADRWRLRWLPAAPSREAFPGRPRRWKRHVDAVWARPPT